MSVDINDSLKSLATNLGERFEKTRYYNNEPLNEEELMALWSSSWVVQKICSKKASDMTRRWRVVKSNDLTSMELEALEKLEKKYKLKSILERACMWCSLYGGVGILVLTDVDPSMPLIAGQKLERLILVSPQKVAGVGMINDDILSANYGKFDTYRINGKVNVHHSRLIIMNGVSKGIDEKEIWGYSDIQAVYETIKRFDYLCTNITDLVAESKVDVFKMDGLNSSLLAGQEKNIANAMQQVQLIKSITNSLLIDKDYEYEQKELTFAGLTDILKEFRNAVAGAADMPVTILFGQSVSGLASGDEDTENYHETIHRLQEQRLRPVFEVLDPLFLSEITNKTIDDFWFEFESLKDMKQEEKITMFNSFAQGAVGLIQAGVLTEEQAAKELRDSGLVNCISDEDIEALEGIVNERHNEQDYRFAFNHESATTPIS